MQIVRARFPEFLNPVRELMQEYGSIPEVAVCVTSYAEEMASLPGRYAEEAGGVVLLAIIDGRPAGCVAMRKWEPGICEMKRLYVRPGARGTGAGRTLVNALMEYARETGYQRMRLDTLPRMPQAIALYRSLGFVEIEPYMSEPIPGAICFEADVTGDEPTHPILRTGRLLLRPPVLADSPRIHQLAGAIEVARGVLSIPHPYPPDGGEKWIAWARERFESDEGVVFAIQTLDDPALLGAIGLNFDSGNRSAELGYWIGVPYWGRGYATEAARAVVEYGFTVRGVHRVQARHFGSNPASGRVLQKIGMKHEGVHPDSILKWGAFEDLHTYGMLAPDWKRQS